MSGYWELAEEGANMSFLSISFVIFVAILVVMYYLVPSKMQWCVLLAGSCFFYLYAGYRTFIFLVIVTYLTYSAGIYFGKVNLKYEEYVKSHIGITKQEKRVVKAEYNKKKKIFLVSVIAVNFGFLFLFKYFNVIDGIGQLFADIWHIDNMMSGINMILPLGISYYTFQATGYMVDVYRNKYVPEKNFARYALFVSFFPQLVQGPISRYDELGMQLYEPHKFDYKNLTFGCQLILWGYFKKLVIDTRLSIVIGTVMQSPSMYPGLYITFAVLLQGLKVYLDFSSGIDIARGVAEVFGIDMPKNFFQPLFAQSVGEYWVRWHISLNNWWRDYVFYPFTLSKKVNAMGKFFKKILGNDLGRKMPVFFGLMLVRTLNSLWHGGTSTYLARGLYHGTIVSIPFFLSTQLEQLNERLHIDTGRRSWKIFRIVRTYLLISIPNIMIYCGGMKDVANKVKYMFSTFNPWIFFDDSLYKLGVDRKEWQVVIVTVFIVFIVDFLHEKKVSVRELVAKQNIIIRWSAYYLLIFGIIILGVYGPGYNVANFVYAQF